MSSASCSSIEAAVAEAPKNTWFQVYGTRNPEITADLVARATRLDVPVLVLTVDTPVIGKRERNIRNGFRRPDEDDAGRYPAGFEPTRLDVPLSDGVEVFP